MQQAMRTCACVLVAVCWGFSYRYGCVYRGGWRGRASPGGGAPVPQRTARAAAVLYRRARRYGANEMAIPVKSLGSIIFDEMWHPFYVFQYFSILVWIIGDQYYSYSVCIAVITWCAAGSAGPGGRAERQRWLRLLRPRLGAAPVVAHLDPSCLSGSGGWLRMKACCACVPCP